MSKDYFDIDEEDDLPRPAICIRSDNSVWGGGGDPDHKLTIGKIYIVSRMIVEGFYTLLKIKGFNEYFNSVLFRDLTKSERKKWEKEHNEK